VVNFINVLWAAFAPVDPKRIKRYWWLDWIFTLLGATCVKAVRRTLMKLSPKERLIIRKLLDSKFFQRESTTYLTVMTSYDLNWVCERWRFSRFFGLILFYRIDSWSVKTHVHSSRFEGSRETANWVLKNKPGKI